MSSESILALFALTVLITGILTFVIYRFIYFKAKQMQNKYYLYKVRDDLIQLAVDGKLEENGFLFNTFYPFVNNLINKINSFKLNDILKAISHQNQMIESKEFLIRFNKEIENQPKEVVEVFDELFESIVRVIYRNSFVIRSLIRLSRYFMFVRKAIDSCKDAPQFVIRVFSSYFAAFEYTKIYNGMIQYKKEGIILAP